MRNFFLVILLLVQPIALTSTARGQATSTNAELRISGEVSTPLVLTAADLKKMPRKKLSVVNPHDKKNGKL
jgi:DMSO/TMAO reductase YedYZ molybdopterin-dependent catalytic subunit